MAASLNELWLRQPQTNPIFDETDIFWTPVLT